MFWSKLCKSSWNCAAWNLAFPVFISPILWNMCENLHYESVYFKELHNQQEYYWPTIYRTGAAVVSTITSNNMHYPFKIFRSITGSVWIFQAKTFSCLWTLLNAIYASVYGFRKESIFTVGCKLPTYRKTWKKTVMATALFIVYAIHPGKATWSDVYLAWGSGGHIK